jgi:hypothetical protein
MGSMGTWKGHQVFVAGKGGAAPALAKFCSYAWNLASAPGDPDVTALTDKFSTAGQDCPPLAPQAPLNTFQTWARHAFLDSVVRKGAPRTAEGGKRVRVIVLDTAPDGDAAEPVKRGYDRHGDTLGHLIQDIACEGHVEECTVEVRTKLVMPLRADDLEVEHEEGGNLGRLEHAATAIDQELARWRAEVVKAMSGDAAAVDAVPARLVFNMSFGFDDVPGEVASNACSDPINNAAGKMLHQAMQLAACHGAILVAAAGNHAGGPQPEPSEGLLCPARWRHPPGPDLTCAMLLPSEYSDFLLAYQQMMTHKTGAQVDPDPVPPVGAPSPQVVYAIGAVDDGGLPLVLSRANACPDFVALGGGATDWKQPSGSGGVATMIADVPAVLFGTSVSAAVASGIFAARLAQDGERGGAPVVSLSRSEIVASVAVTRGRPQTHGACPQMEARDGGLHGTATYTVCNESTPRLGRKKADGTATSDLPRQNPPVSQEALSRFDFAPITYGRTYMRPGFCPEEIPHCARVSAFATAQKISYLQPTPTIPPCLECLVELEPTADGEIGGATFYLDPNPDAEKLGSWRAVLILENKYGEVVSTTALEDFPLSGTTTFTLRWVTPLKADPTSMRAWLSGYYGTKDNPYSWSQQIFVK